jgi:hypothetical protein
MLYQEKAARAWQERLTECYHHLYLTASSGRSRLGSGAVALWAFDGSGETMDELVRLPRRYFTRRDMLEACFKIFDDERSIDSLSNTVNGIAEMLDTLDPANEICLVVFGFSQDHPVACFRINRPPTGNVALSAYPTSLN